MPGGDPQRDQKSKNPGKPSNALNKQVKKLKRRLKLFNIDIQDLSSCPEAQRFVEFVVAHMVAQSIWEVWWRKGP